MAPPQIRTPLPVYAAGTISGTAGSAALTGTNTSWVTTDASGNAVNAVMGGDLFVASDRSIPIKSVDSATQITLENPLPASIAAGSAYRIIKYSPNLSGGVTAALGQVLAAGSDASPEQSLAVDNGGGRVKLRIGADGNPQIAVGPAGAADSALVTAFEISPTSIMSKLPMSMSGNIDEQGSFSQFGAESTGTYVGIELGSLTTAGNAYIDFHSSGSANDFDVRVAVTGGANGTAGQGTLAFAAGAIIVPTPPAGDNSTKAASMAAVNAAFAATTPFITPQMPMFASLVTHIVGIGAGDDSPALQAMFDYCAKNGLSWFVPDGVYLCSSPLIIRQPSTAFGYTGPDSNYYGLPANTWRFGNRAILRASTAMAALVTLGAVVDSDFSQLLHNTHIYGGIFDGNFLAQICVAAPHFYAIFFHEGHCKNFLKTGWKCGSLTSPNSSGGVAHIHCTTWRDIQPFRANISAISKSNPCTLTAPNHGYAIGTPRVATVDNAVDTSGNAIAGLAQQFFDIKVVDANTIQLLNVDSTNWNTYQVNSAQIYLCFPSQQVPKQISAVSTANPCVITTATPHLFTNGQQVFLADVGNIPQLDGVWTATVISSTTFSVPTSGASFSYQAGSGPGWAETYVPETSMIVAVDYENAADADDIDCEFSGVQIGFASTSRTGGYDGKKAKCHVYNYNEQGLLWAAYSLGGTNQFSLSEVDGPFRFAFILRDTNNVISQAETNYSGGQAVDLQACPIRLEGSATVLAQSCIWKSSNAANARMLREVSGNLSGYRGENSRYPNLGVYSPIQTRRDDLPVAYVRFTTNGSNAPVITDSKNVGSVTRNSAGDYTVTALFNNGTIGRTHVAVENTGGQVTPTMYAPPNGFQRRVQVNYQNSPIDPAGAVSMSIYGIYPTAAQQLGGAL